MLLIYICWSSKTKFFPSNVAACALGNLQAHQLLIVQIGFISPLRSSMHVTRNNYGFSVYSILGWEVLYVVRKHKGDWIQETNGEKSYLRKVILTTYVSYCYKIVTISELCLRLWTIKRTKRLLVWALNFLWTIVQKIWSGKLKIPRVFINTTWSHKLIFLYQFKVWPKFFTFSRYLFFIGFMAHILGSRLSDFLLCFVWSKRSWCSRSGITYNSRFNVKNKIDS